LLKLKTQHWYGVCTLELHHSLLIGLTGEFEGWGPEPDQELGALSESTKCFHHLYWPLYSGAAQNH